ncbi:MAG TPA: KpsF/GutQ family sugar-phosphate isomerase [Candidatus Polarisedimenticolaceae bacterium]|nr:KpsF/GutQ family sugar-phosphate isomerase [Candidatus Polarisedimenticolaceae bacterium]
MTTKPQPRPTARRVFAIESRAIDDLASRLDASFDRAVELLLGCRGRVIVTGMGKSGIIAQKIAATLSSTGCPAYFLHPAEAVHGDLGMIVSGDLLLALSNSGETAELVRLLELVRRLGARVVALSGDPRSTLARFADVHLDVGVDREACGLDLVPTASTTAALAMGDALAVATYEQRGFSATDFARFHPGGRLGRKLQQVQQLMHRGQDVPRVAAAATLAATVEEIDRKKLGMTCVVDDDGRLCGVLTDGDLRRRMLRVERPMEGTAGEAMTRGPSTIGAEALASEALKMMEDRKITSLPVVDPSGLVLGVIQIHDLWRTDLF